MDITDQKSAKPLSVYYMGNSTTVACQSDQRFSYCTYTPKGWSQETAHEYRLLVVVHGSDRAFQEIRQEFVPLAETRKLIILSPLFPSGIGCASDTDGYKYIEFQGIRFDHILLDMVAETARRYGIDVKKFSLFGFSGGAHFAHRLFYLHPERLTALSVAAPGSVTLLNHPSPWWVGTGDFENRFGKKLDLKAMQRVRTQLLVGDQDLKNSLIIHAPDSPTWVEGANDAGKTRVERLNTLYNNWKVHGLDAEFTLLRGIGHKLSPLAGAARKWFEGQLEPKT